MNTNGPFIVTSQEHHCLTIRRTHLSKVFSLDVVDYPWGMQALCLQGLQGVSDEFLAIFVANYSVVHTTTVRNDQMRLWHHYWISTTSLILLLVYHDMSCSRTKCGTRRRHEDAPCSVKQVPMTLLTSLYTCHTMHSATTTWLCPHFNMTTTTLHSTSSGS